MMSEINLDVEDYIPLGRGSSTKPVYVKIYNLNGKEIKALVGGYRNAGSYQVVWDGTNNLGQKISSGIYVYRLQAGEFSKSVKMTLIQ